ncbi:MAG: EF-hand domain-containing protein [Sulfuriferula sp.]
MSKTLICILGVALTAPVYAATAVPPASLDNLGGQPKAMNPLAMQSMMMQRFQQSDADHNGALTRQEAGSNMPVLAQHFDEVDVNHDGQVSREEMQAAFAQHTQSQGATGISKN